MKIGELAKRTGMTAYTIRYYEGIGLLPYVKRDDSSQRDYDVSILPWIEFLGRLKTTGMPIRDMVRYAELRKLGPATNQERSHILEQHREQVLAHVAELQACLLVLDQKIAGYAGATDPNQPISRIKDVSKPPAESPGKSPGTRHARTRRD